MKHWYKVLRYGICTFVQYLTIFFHSLKHQTMERKSIIQPFAFTEEQQKIVLSKIDEAQAAMNFLISLGKDGRVGLLKVEEGKLTKPRGIHKILTENATVNKSDSLSIDAFGKKIDNYDGVYAVKKRVLQFLEYLSDTSLGIGNEIGYDAIDGQKQITRAAKDKTEHEGLLVELKNLKPAAKPTAKQLEKKAEKLGYIKMPDDAKKWAILDGFIFI